MITSSVLSGGGPFIWLLLWFIYLFIDKDLCEGFLIPDCFNGAVPLTGCALPEIQVPNVKILYYSTVTEHLYIVEESLQSKPLKSPLFFQWSSDFSKQSLYSAHAVRVIFGPFSWVGLSSSIEWTNLKTPVIIVKFCDLTSTFQSVTWCCRVSD